MQNLLYLPVIRQLDGRMARVKAGYTGERETFINDYIPFIIKSVSNITNRYIESERSDEYIVGLEAFNEAIDKYDSSKGRFISFASLVIKSRVTDFLRKQDKYSVEILQYAPEETLYGKAEADYYISDITDSIALKDEIKEFADKLRDFGITFCDLVRESPKHKDTRLNALGIAHYIYSRNELKQELMCKKKLPITKLIKELNVSEKIIYKSKIFIIAAVLILDSSMDCLKGYISEVGGGERNDI